eukprot:4620049-Prymnesium_polylepis.1
MPLSLSNAYGPSISPCRHTSFNSGCIVVCHVSPVGVGARSGSATLTYARSTVKEWCEAAQLSRLSSPDPLTGPRIASGRVSARSRREAQSSWFGRSYRPCRGDPAVASS